MKIPKIPLLWSSLLISAQTALAAVQVEGFDKNGKSVGAIPLGTHTSTAIYYVVGSTTTPPVEMWIPFQGGIPDGHVDIITRAMAKLVEASRATTANGTDGVSFKLRVADWGIVASAPVCTVNTTCPDVLIVGTTQVAARVEAGDLEPLDEYFQSAVLAGQSMPSDDFPRGAFYDYYLDGQWYGVPYNSDIRALYYNPVTLANLSITAPPSGPNPGAWGSPYSKTWTWDKFMDDAKAIKDATGQPSAFFPSSWDEEIKVVAAIARNYGAQILTKDHKCGMTSDHFRTMLDEVFVRMFLRDESASKNFLNPDQVAALMAKPMPANPLDYDAIGQLCCQDIQWPINGFLVASPSDALTHVGPNLQLGYLPGTNTFLGGAGMAITKKGKNKDWAWKLISTIISHDEPFLQNIADVMSSPPPSEYFMDSSSEYNSGDGLTMRESMKSAIPPQYPLPTFPQFGDLESYKPIRILLYELIFLRLSPDLATTRACQIIDYIFSPTCSSANYNTSQSTVSDSGTISIDFAWQQPLQCKLKGAAALPDSILGIKAQMLPVRNGASVGIVSATAILSFVLVGYMAVLTYYRKAAAVKRASYMFSMLIVLGGVLSHGFIYSVFGTPSHYSCIVRTWFLVIGFSLCFGGLTLKTYRIHVIFNIAAKKAKKGYKLTDIDLLKLFAVLMVIEVGLLVVWTFWDNPGVETATLTVPNTPYTYTLTQCSGPNVAADAMLLFFNGLLILYSVYLSWLTRRVQTDFNEGKFVMMIVYAICFACIVVLPVSSFLDDFKPRAILQSVVIMLVSSWGMSVFIIPKIIQAYHGAQKTLSNTNLGHTTSTGSDSGTSDSDPTVRCPQCRTLIFVGHATTGSARTIQRKPEFSSMTVKGAGGMLGPSTMGRDPLPNPNQIHRGSIAGDKGDKEAKQRGSIVGDSGRV
ncbi:hypothetical protein HDV00_002671 [Rhizophlyctis rosea]|nr:hypothetical protein HDV00_002671 [Rhizophlyctis rosea]